MVKQLLSLAELAELGVAVTICKPGKAKGVKKQKCRAKGGGSFVRGGNKPVGYSQMAW